MKYTEHIVLEDILLSFKKLQTQLTFLKLEFQYIDRQYELILDKFDKLMKEKDNDTV